MSARRPWQGMLNVARFNWPFYGAALAVTIAALAGLIWLPPVLPKLICAAALAGAGYFLLGSFGVCHLIYDRSDLYRWRWLDRALRGARLERAIFCHCGFDETSVELRERFPKSAWQLLDHYDPTRMTEASIQRARQLYPPAPGTAAAPFDRWPVEAEWADVVFALLAIHELRSDAERRAWFAEARRSLRGEGRVILVEHVRDFANFIAFGPGFVHFHSPVNWRGAWESAGLRLADEFRVTPWVRVFVLTRS